MPRLLVAPSTGWCKLTRAMRVPTIDEINTAARLQRFGRSGRHVGLDHVQRGAHAGVSASEQRIAWKVPMQSGGR